MGEVAHEAPSESTETDGLATVRCQRCGREAEAIGKGQCSACGCWLPANEGALTHGGRRLQTGNGSRLDEVNRTSIRDAVLADLGGESEVSTVLYELCEDFAAACVLRNLAWAHIAAVGPLTLKGRRRAVVSLYLEASGRAERLASRIGLERKAPPGPSLTEYLKGRTTDKDDDNASGEGTVEFIKDRKDADDA